MGLDITVLIVDWDRVERTPAAARQELLDEAELAILDDEEPPQFQPRGWVWPAAPEDSWYACYEFHSTSGSYKPHFWAGQVWEDVRDFADPALRSALDAFLSRLIWRGLDGDAVHVEGDGLAHRDADSWLRLLLACPPAAVHELAEQWARAAPRLEALREPFAEHAAQPGRWTGTFAEFEDLLTEWGEVVCEADRRGWGLAGLP